MAESIGKASSLSLIFVWAILPLSVLTNIVVARVLGPEVKGQYTVFVTTLSLLLLPGSAGSASLTHFVAQRRPDVSVLFRFLTRTVIIQTLVTVAVLGLLIQLPALRGLFFSGLDSVYLVAVLASTSVNLWCLYREAVLAGFQLYTKSIVWGHVRFLITTLLVLAVLGFWWFQGSAPLLSWIVIAQVCALFVGVAVFMVGTANTQFAGGNIVSSPEMWLALSVFAAPLLLRNVLEWCNLRADVYFVNAFGSDRELGVYTVAVGLAQQMWMVPTAIAGPLFARISQEGNNQVGRETARRAVRVTGVSCLVFGVGVSVSAPVLLPIVYGARFQGVVPLLMILLPGVIAIGTTRAMGTYLTGIGKPREVLWAEALGLCATFVFNFILTSRFGAYGAAMASSIAYFLFSFYLTQRFLKFSESTLADLCAVHKDWEYIKSRLPKKLRRS